MNVAPYHAQSVPTSPIRSPSGHSVNLPPSGMIPPPPPPPFPFYQSQQQSYPIYPIQHQRAPQVLQPIPYQNFNNSLPSTPTSSIDGRGRRLSTQSNSSFSNSPQQQSHIPLPPRYLPRPMYPIQHQQQQHYPQQPHQYNNSHQPFHNAHPPNQYTSPQFINHPHHSNPIAPIPMAYPITSYPIGGPQSNGQNQQQNSGHS